MTVFDDQLKGWFADGPTAAEDGLQRVAPPSGSYTYLSSCGPVPEVGLDGEGSRLFEEMVAEA